MKRFLKIFGIVIGSILLLIILIPSSVKIFEDSIAKRAVKEVSKSINAPVDINSVNLNLIRKFPKATFEFNNLWLKSPDNPTDTIAGLKHLYVSVNTREAIKGKYIVEKVAIDGMELNYNINSDSISNIDFLMSLMPPVDSTEAQEDLNSLPDTTLYFDLNELIIKNLTCTYYDATTNIGARVRIPKVTLKGNIMGDDYTAESDGNIMITNVSYENYNMELMQKASLDFKVHYIGDSAQIDKFAFQTDGVDISASGTANVGNNTILNASLKAGKIDLGELIKYMPQEMKDEYGLISAQGVFTFNSTVIGEYNDSVMPKVTADFSFKDGAFVTKDYPEIKHFSLAGTATNGAMRNNASSEFSLSSLKLETPQSHIFFSAKVKDLDQPNYNVKTDGSVLLDEFAAFIPKDALESISGKIDWNISSYGTVPHKIGDDFTHYVMSRSRGNISVRKLYTTVDSSLSIEDFNTDFTYTPYHFIIKDLSIGVPSYDIALKNTSADISIKGKTTDIDNMAINLNGFHLEFDNNSLDLKAYISNLTNPDYMMDGSINLDLADLQRFVPDTLVTDMNGTLNGHIYSKGSIDLDSIETQAMPLAFESTTVALNCNNINVKMPDTLMEISNLNLAMKMIPDTITIDHFSGDYKGLDFAIDSTKIYNAYHSVVLNEKEELKVITSIKIGDIDYAMFEPFTATTEDSTASEEAEIASIDTTGTDSTITNYTMDIKGDIAISSIKVENYEVDSTMTIKQFNIDDLTAKFRVTDSSYIVDSLIFYALGGYMNTSMRYDIKPDDKAVASIRNNIDGMDFKQLMEDMDNFGQTDFTAENISGKLKSTINAETTLLGDSVPMNLIKMKGLLELSDGGVYDFEPAQSLSKFTGLNELDNIRFQTLKTKIFVHKGAVYVPKTDIINSAMDITAFGMQSFGDDYEYHLEIHLGDILTGKSDNLMKRQAKAAKDSGDDVDRNGVKLIAYSLDGKSKNGFDNKKSRRTMTNRIITKNGVLSMVFYPELVDFKTDF